MLSVLLNKTFRSFLVHWAMLQLVSSWSDMRSKLVNTDRLSLKCMSVFPNRILSYMVSGVNPEVISLSVSLSFVSLKTKWFMSSPPTFPPSHQHSIIWYNYSYNTNECTFCIHSNLSTHPLKLHKALSTRNTEKWHKLSTSLKTITHL